MNDLLSFSIKNLTKAPVTADPDASYHLAGGGEGDVYRIPDMDGKVAKIYHPNMLTRNRQSKVLDLCSRYETYAGLLANGLYAFPELPATKSVGKEVVGFAMANMDKMPTLELLSYGKDNFQKASGVQLDDRKAIKLVYDLFACIAHLHSARIILGDVNPGNILFDPKGERPAFIDLDAATIGNYACVSYMNEYLDPLLVEDGEDADGHNNFNIGSDYFALACIAFRLFVGCDPFGFRTKPVMSPDERKQKRICLMGYLEDPDYGNTTGCALLDNPQNTFRLDRLKILKQKDRIIYDYLFRVFLQDYRESLLRLLPKTDPRHPEFSFHAKGKAKTIVDHLKEKGMVQHPDARPKISFKSKTQLVNAGKVAAALTNYLEEQYVLRRETQTMDPKGFSAFINNLGFSYDNIIRQGT